jgi:hypothetical protein
LKRGFPGDFSGFAGVVPLPPAVHEIDLVEDHRQVCGLDPDMTGHLGHSGRELKASFFEPLIPKDISIDIPIEYLDSIAAMTP